MKIIVYSLLLALLPMVANAESVEINGIYYNLISKTKTAEVTSNPNYYSGNVVIPASVTYDGNSYNVTSIASNAFYGCNLTSIAIPSSVTSIGQSAFGNCYALTSVHISDITAWCKINFYHDGGSLASNPLEYAHHLYLNGSEIKNLIIPNNVTSIGDFVFYKCWGLTSVTIPNNVISIGESAFAYCTGLTSVSLSNGVTSIGMYAFSDCRELTSITIPNSVTSIGEYNQEIKGKTNVEIIPVSA